MDVTKLSDIEYLAVVRGEVLTRVLADLASRGMKYEAALLAAELGERIERRLDPPASQSYPVKIVPL